MTRAFVAVQPPPEVLDAVAATTAGVDVPGARRTTRAQWHLTLQFLGNTADVDATADALQALSVLAGPVRFGGAGAFPSTRRAKVLWVGVTEGGELLASLAREVAALLAPLGFEPERRVFHPHLTLARAQEARDLRPVIAALDACTFGHAWTVRDVVLYESRLRREGAEYIPRAVLTLPS